MTEPGTPPEPGEPGTPPEPGIRVVDNPAASRYEIWLGDVLAGYSDYALEDGVLTFLHTEVDEAFEGRGLGSRLAAGAIADIRARGLRMRAECPFIGAYIVRHRAEVIDLLARRSQPSG